MIKKDISELFDLGVKRGATHMIMVCDTFDWTDYPVYVEPTEDVNEVEKKYSEEAGNMQRVMEVYNLSMEKEPQMDAHRSWNY